MGIKETVYYEGGPHVGDLIINGLLGLTVICLPFTVGAIVRALWLRYRITDRRLSVIGGWRGRDQTDVVYTEITKLVKIPRGIGLWGDIILTLNDKSRLEMRAVPRYRQLHDYIADKVANKTGKPLEAITTR
ncbi:MAG: PH domain-containing protein [Halothece sp.]